MVGSLAFYLLLAAELADPCLPPAFHYGDVIRDDRDGIMIVGAQWIGVGKVAPNGRAMHVIWTQRTALGCADNHFWPAYYSWDVTASRWRGYFGGPEDPYTRDEVLWER